ncbi:nucleotide exchange factor GrpE [Staphylococcus chromogenes]|uniref:nucleotide exchange factor GrpE n=1 Tax=Staphylococcus chromogenes TaxID=46126 RepID=UPI000D1A4ED0|nr:nucleotide exchange factor GrpE [Staphylococcus chromogenes]MCE4965913.1 nucleotide exchange factor GrpE [Staphylococcus chromogenes]PTF67407.1 nucleotide exchange factor GrpE [Staphylococcus chromogenes]PTF68188.1 nucleotide exchange factor GrpE [Staphylococcus chromogenes]PTF75269.1 nucleotide exchange factor GrpE [Staphylococcus chromogenes]PTF78022.1 nucleotide exchange factor GrpE [Staphylococcus chromogenes]
MSEEKDFSAQETNEENTNDDVTQNAAEASTNSDSASTEEVDTEVNQEDVDPKDEEITSLKTQVDQEQEKYLRLYAEFENYKRRIQKENDTQRKYQAQGVLSDILPALDNFERALQIEGDDESFNSLKKGVEMVYSSLVKALEDNGLEAIKSEGEAFDPNYHQAVVQDNNPDFESGHITEELQKGYKLKDRVLRPSMVKVNQ